jgi:hypothetical protein
MKTTKALILTARCQIGARRFFGTSLRAKRSNPAARRQARRKSRKLPRVLRFFVGALRAHWIASLRSQRRR